MSNFYVKNNQNGLDVINNTYTSLDNTYQMYLDNTEFDLNLMQKDLNLQYNATITKTINSINNNNYTFTNGNINIYQSILKLNVGTGIYENQFKISIVGEDNPDFKIINESTQESLITSDKITISVFDTYNVFNVLIDALKYSDGIIFNSIDISELDVNSIILDNVINVGGNLSLILDNNIKINDFSFLNKLHLVDVDNDHIDLSIKNNIQTTDKMILFINDLLASELANPSDYGNLIISSNDIVPSGTNWTTLVANGWDYTII